MRNIIITTSIVFIAVIVTSYFYFSNLRQNDLLNREGLENAESDHRVEDETGTEHAPLWSFALNAHLSTEPTVYDLDSANRFVLAQDAYHILYAISANGEQLWNAQLPGPILGGIQQLADRTLLFTTEERLYRIDIDGDPLPGFSLQLPHKATYGASVWTADDGSVHIEVPAKNRILSYDGQGKHLPNQTPKTSAEDIATEADTSIKALENSRQPRFPSGCGPLFYTGPLLDDGTYLICGKSDRKLYCFRYE